MSTSDGSVCLLQPLGLLSIRGPDALRFLQGQLSNDLGALADVGAAGGQLLRAGLHSPQGRVLALLGLVAAGPDAVLAVLPRELVGPTRATLQRYVLRSKVALADESEAYRIYGLTDAVGGGGNGGGVTYEGARRLLIAGAADTAAQDAAAQGEPLPYSAWHAADVAAGLPQVYAATSGQFVAQMLNLDSIGAISFTKGCYTGQEVIARAHYRGRVKRRMQRFISRDPLQLAPGNEGEFAGGGRFRVVDSVQHADGRCEFLAVAAQPNTGGAPEHGVGAGDPSDAPGAAASGEAARIEAITLPLPYPLPD